MKNQTNKHNSELENFILAFPYKQFLPWSDLSISNEISVEFFIENKALIKKYILKNKYGDYYSEYDVCKNPNLKLSDLFKLDPEDINYKSLSSNQNIDVFDVLSIPDAPWDFYAFFDNPNFIELFISKEIFAIPTKLKNIMMDYDEELDEIIHRRLSDQEKLDYHIDWLYTSKQSVLLKNYYDNRIHLHKRQDNNTDLIHLLYDIDDIEIIKSISEIIRKLKLNEHYNLVTSTIYIKRFYEIPMIAWCLEFLGNDFVEYLKKVKNNSDSIFKISQIIMGYFHQK